MVPAEGVGLGHADTRPRCAHDTRGKGLGCGSRALREAAMATERGRMSIQLVRDLHVQQLAYSTHWRKQRTFP